ncbi:maturation protein [ssRNA phage Gerhypos.3_20]|uniref:Maturation protein n=2 Tax=Leviviricetes TaxID=2842243 RepID=A0A8S5L023_9VIRU|nr:maturation protein [ssRNA phage Gerhypos.3_20]QDH88964.1 MAG: hypothetical protein H3Bulk42285_000001 [Leviviridae sp.]DAD50458.1 TPA_asm: maturation protein [ssRNA phage Gerhypos.3_20]
MGGMYTESRRNKNILYRKFRSSNGLLTRDDVTDTTDDTVTSYRSGGERDPSVISWQTTTRNGFEASPEYDKGHVFSSTQQQLFRSHDRYYVANADKSVFYDGPLVIANPSDGTIGFPQPSIPSWDPNQFGSVAIDNTIPTSSLAGLSQFLGEIEKTPKVLFASLPDYTYKANFFRNLGGEYLNAQFGWVPFMTDLRNFIEGVRDMNKIMSQTFKDNGKVIRRKYEFPPKLTSTSTNLGITRLNILTTSDVSNYFQSLFSSQADARGILTLDTLTSERIYFKGAYSYNMPMDDSVLSNMTRTEFLCNKILGTRITPSVLWELAPWSWLADWFVQIGPLLANLTAFQFDGLVLRYGYIMRHTTVTHTYTLDGIRFKGKSPGPIRLTLVTTRKERVKATPYGFGVNPNEFSDNQWAILLALGMAKSKGVLK